jgi:RNA polymerase sigma factor (sigma-70 family)
LAFLDSYARLVRLAALMVGADAEDAVMDAYVRVRSRPRTVESPTAYFRTAVVNECRSRIRGRMRLPRLLERIADVRPEPEPAEPDSTWALLAELSPDQRVVVALRFYEDLTVPQIAELLDVPDGTVKSHLHRAVQRLRTSMGTLRDE